MSQLRSRERLLKLLADRALGGLTPDLEAELQRLLEWHPEIDPLSMEWTAAAVSRVSPEPELAMPVELMRRIERDALGGESGVLAIRPEPAKRRLGRTLTWSGWVAAAVCLALAAWAWRPVAAIDAERQRAALLSLDGTQLVQASGPAGGDVAWHDGRQEGYLRLRGVPANDPRRSQYQLWIFDAARDDRFPVDGGVFDVPPGDEVVLPVQARLRVDRPTLFAVTRERPGGVVVSDRKEIVWLAQVDAGR